MELVARGMRMLGLLLLVPILFIIGLIVGMKELLKKRIDLFLMLCLVIAYSVAFYATPLHQWYAENVFQLSVQGCLLWTATTLASTSLTLPILFEIARFAEEED
jgi:Kef-type K+ transport system membrane component KefB